MEFRSHQLKSIDAPLVGVFIGHDYFYKAILPLGADIVEARILAKKILAEGFKSPRGENDILPSELSYCYIATRVELISKES